MTGLKIYGTARSRTARVLWMATELGLPFEHTPLTMGDGALKQPPFLKINPAGRVPAIDDNGFAMSESLAINLYLARKYGERATPSLAPASLEEEAKIWRWSCWALTDLEIPLNTIHLHRNFFPPDKRDAKAAEDAEAQVQRPLAMLDKVLAESPYLLGSRFTVADLNVACVLSASRLSAIDIAAFPQVADWAKRCHERPASLAVQAMRKADA
ncbi:glutathione S-transferase family protein [Dongia deserti]|uniref:glutathione S-transferase family protein n=1 Tax=Dongia deserti TaxID=2268030 RepID=UPI0013C52849|nr:glutathione S-transferase family protein [Dongia deserti]